MKDRVFIVFNNSPALHIETPFRDKIKVFCEPDNALKQATDWGFEDPFGLGGSCPAPGVKRMYACGDVNVEILPLEMEDGLNQTVMRIRDECQKKHDELETMRAENSRLTKEIEERNQQLAAVRDGLQWAGDGYEWSPVGSDYRDNFEEVIKRASSQYRHIGEVGALKQAVLILRGACEKFPAHGGDMLEKALEFTKWTTQKE
jgi:hypothetical protein